MNKFMKLAVEEATKGIKKGHGGPFGAVIVKDNRVIARAHNQVIKSKDPTAHAEMLAIREASRKLRRFDLSDCILYSTCEPCPMCYEAIHWARIRKMYYGCTAKDAAAIGFDDKCIYDILKGKRRRRIRARSLNRKECLKPFKAWAKKADKVKY
jgi:guanine deaminase